MNTDIRISISFLGHRKRKKLKAMLGPGSTDYLLDLWISTAMNHPTGVLAGMSELDIALEAGWEGNAQEFADALMQCGFLEYDTEETCYRLHEWEDHQPYVCHARERSDHGKKAARARWDKKLEKDRPQCSNAQAANEQCPEHSQALPVNELSNAQNQNEQCTEHNRALLIDESGNAPSPFPDPIPEPNPIPMAQKEPPHLAPRREIQPDQSNLPQTAKTPKTLKAKAGEYTDAFIRFWEVYPRQLDKLRAFEVWKRLAPADHERVITAARNYSAEMRRLRKDAEYIRYPKTFLDKNAWRDWETGSPGIHANTAAITDAEKKAIIAKHTDKEGQRNDIAVVREIRALERQRSVEYEPDKQLVETSCQQSL